MLVKEKKSGMETNTWSFFSISIAWFSIINHGISSKYTDIVHERRRLQFLEPIKALHVDLKDVIFSCYKCLVSIINFGKVKLNRDQNTPIILKRFLPAYTQTVGIVFTIPSLIQEIENYNHFYESLLNSEWKCRSEFLVPTEDSVLQLI